MSPQPARNVPHAVARSEERAGEQQGVGSKMIDPTRDFSKSWVPRVDVSCFEDSTPLRCVEDAGGLTCGSRLRMTGVASEAVDIAFERCYNDTAPFDRVP